MIQLKNKLYTLIFIQKENSFLLGYKKRGFGANRWNGFGGKVEKNESIFEGAQRELKEESGVSSSKLKFVGLITFTFKKKPEEALRVHVFKSSEFSGEIIETEEMKPKWFDFKEIPYDNMWPDDKLWYDLLRKEVFFICKFNFSDEDTIIDYDIKEVSEDNLLKSQEELVNYKLK